MTVRPATLTAGAPLIVLLLAVLVHVLLEPILICHDEALVRPVVSAAVVAPSEPATEGCPGCVRDVPSPAAWDPCSDHPCHHAPTGGHSSAEGASHTLRSPRTDAPDVPVACSPLDRDDPLSPALSPTGPVPLPAALSPVAVLCVDRN